MARRRTSGATLSSGEVVPTVVISQFGTLEAEALSLPRVRVFPAIIDMFLFADGTQAVIAQTDNITTRGVQPTTAVTALYMAGVNALQVQVDGLAPRSTDVISPHHIVGPVGGIVDVILPVAFGQVGGPNITRSRGKDTTERLPMNQVGRVPDEETGLILECGVRHVIIIAITQDRRVRIITRQDGVNRPLCRTN